MKIKQGLSQSCRHLNESNGVIAFFFFDLLPLKPLMSGSVLWVCACVCAFMQDKQEIPWWLGVSYKGIGQYDLQDKLKPRKVSLNVFFILYIIPFMHDILSVVVFICHDI